jgi:hypothetical protein
MNYLTWGRKFPSKTTFPAEKPGLQTAGKLKNWVADVNAPVPDILNE